MIQLGVGYPRDAPATVLFGEWFRFGKPSDRRQKFVTCAMHKNHMKTTQHTKFILANLIHGFILLNYEV
ncbi:hypothetical protein LXL04_003001 [Taraxacum kok-saghyz]